jgi:hypothetical protein
MPGIRQTCCRAVTIHACEATVADSTPLASCRVTVSEGQVALPGENEAQV